MRVNIALMPDHPLVSNHFSKRAFKVIYCVKGTPERLDRKETPENTERRKRMKNVVRGDSKTYIPKENTGSDLIMPLTRFGNARQAQTLVHTSIYVEDRVTLVRARTNEWLSKEANIGKALRIECRSIKDRWQVSQCKEWTFFESCCSITD